MLKSKLISVFTLIVLLMGIVQASSALGVPDQNELTTLDIDGQNYSVSDIESEIQAIEEQQEVSLPVFDPSPVSFNGETPKIAPVLKEEGERLIVQIDLEKTIVTPGQPLRYVIQGTRGFQPAAGEKITIEIIRGEYWGWYSYIYDEFVNFEDRLIERKIVTLNSDGIYEGVFSSSIQDRYTIIIRSNDRYYYYKSRAFNIANIGIFWRVSREFAAGQPHYSVAYVLDTTDFSPITGAAVTLTGEMYTYFNHNNSYGRYSEVLFAGVSDFQGVVEIQFTPPTNFSDNYHFLANLSASFNGEQTYVLRDIYRGGSYWTRDGYQQFSPYEFIISTDKPIYSPGETVQGRVLLWKNDFLKATKQPEKTNFEFKLLTPSQHVLLQKTVNTNSFGVYTFSFTLDSESELGKYSIVTQKDEVISTMDIRVDKYEKPAFRVELELDKDYVAPGKKITGTLVATYYFGKPVTHSEVLLEIGDISTLTGTTNEDGEWKFEYTLPNSLTDSGLYAISINATVTDTVNRKVVASASVQITENVYVWAYVNPWFPKADENVTVRFGAYQYSTGRYYWWNWQPLPEAPVKITLYAMLSPTTSYYLETFESQTDSNGYGSYEFSIPQHILEYTTRFKGTVELDSDDGRKGTSTFYFSVDYSKAEITFDSDSYSAGDVVGLTVQLTNILTDSPIAGDIKVRIFDPDYELIGERIAEIGKLGHQFSFQLSSFAPNGVFYVHVYVLKTFTYDWGSYTYYKYSKTQSFLVGPPQQISLSLDKENYSLSDSMTLTGEVEGNTNAPVMIQFVKKGILTTQYIPKTNADSFSLVMSDISLLAPKVWIYGFAILSTGAILETRLFVEIDTTINVDITSSQNTYAPGDEALIDIEVYDAKNKPISTVLAISFVDSSVYGVEPDPESELEHFIQRDYWPSVWTVSSWKGRQRDWWFWWYDDFYGLSFSGGYISPRGGDVFMQEWAMFTDDSAPTAMAGQKTGDSEVDADVGQKIRDNLPENAYWKPSIILEDGSLTIPITLPDTIGEWTVRVVATTGEGIGVLEKYTFQTFLPFFVEIMKEPFVLQDDVFILKAIVYNYLGELVNIDVSIATDEGIVVLGQEFQTIRLPSDFLGAVSWACLAENPGFINATIYAATELQNGTQFADAIRKPVEIVSNGVELEFKASSFISEDPDFIYKRSSDSVQQREFLEISLGLGATAISSWERLIGYPYGCTEQTISRVVPDALILDYLNQTNQLTNETEELLNDMLTTGLSRLYSQQHPDGGWGWWSSDLTRAYMTSLVLYGLDSVREVGIFIDTEVVKRAIVSLLSIQNNDGSWTPDSWRNIDQVAFTAFVLRSLIKWSDLLESPTAINDAITYITNAWSDSTKQSSYLAALYLDAAMGTGYGVSSFETTMINYLINEVEMSSGGNYWDYTSSSGYWWKALGGRVEITGLAISALVKYNPTTYMPIIRGGVQWLLQKQSRYGWGNTADTSAAISSLIVISKEGFSSDDDTSVTINLNGEIIGEYDLSVQTQSVVYLDMESFVNTGENTISFTKNGIGNVSYYFYSRQVLRALPTIQIPSEIISNVNEEISVELQLNPTSSQVFASNMTIEPLEGDIEPIVNLPQVIQLLTQGTKVYFRYTTPSEVGTYSIPGFRITYRLSNSDQSEFSPGLISRQYGPVELIVQENTLGRLSTSVSEPESSSLPEIQEKIGRIDDVIGLKLNREYSKSSFINTGDFILVTLTIVNDNETLNFIMVEESLPAGFVLDTSSIQHSLDTYTVTSSGITFFFSELMTGTTTVQYGLVASSIRQSLAVPAKLSSMYEEWIVESAPTVLGESRIPIDLDTGEIIKDLTFPVLESLKLTEVANSDSPYLQVSVSASDNWGIASVKVYIKQDSWSSYECFQDAEQWSVKALGVSDGSANVYVEVMDFAGNVFLSGEAKHEIELEDLIVPFGPISLLLLVALISGLVISAYARKQGV
ncbi:MAG: MG2 domain-containing protein [Candidatus Hodarchaeales archaeon]|jgi:hypothetical protein